MRRPAVQTLSFGGLSIAHDDRVLRPRRWTVHQAHWALELLPGLADGPVLELCSGAGQIGLVVAARTTRRLVCVDVDPVAAQYTLHNAWTAGLADRVEMRVHPLGESIGVDERFPLILADPPWVPRDEVGRFPEDPVRAIDGGPGAGLDVAKDCVREIGRHLTTDGCALLQLGSPEQADGLRDDLRAAGLRVAETRTFGARGVLVLVSPSVHPSGGSDMSGSGS